MSNETMNKLGHFLDVAILGDTKVSREVPMLNMDAFVSSPIPTNDNNAYVGIMHENVTTDSPALSDSHLVIDVSDEEGTNALLQAIVKARVYQFLGEDVTDPNIDDMVEIALAAANITVGNIVKTVLNMRPVE